jgi:phosphohistidine phosphatase
MQLYLVQHGAAKSEAEDSQRRLTVEGEETVNCMADYLAALKLRIDRIEHSDKERARQTAQIMAARLHPSEGTRQVAGMAPNDSIEPGRQRLQSEPCSLMIVGHLPYLSRLLSALLLGVQQDRTLVTFQMSGVVHVDRDGMASGAWVGYWFQNCCQGAQTNRMPLEPDFFRHQRSLKDANDHAGRDPAHSKARLY